MALAQPVEIAEWDEPSAQRTPVYDDPAARAARPVGLEALAPVVSRAAGFAVTTVGGFILFMGVLWWLT